MRKVITDANSLSERDKKEMHSFIAKHKGGMAVVAQGGGQLGIFTAGVLDVLLDARYDPFSLYIGTSAGALNLASFLTRQHRLAYHFIREVTTDPQFFNLARFIRHNQGMDLEWAISNARRIPEYDLDVRRGRSSLQGKLGLASATNVADLSAHYLPLFRHDWLDVLKASSAIPLIHIQPVEVESNTYYDGGITAAIPVQEAYRQGARVMVVIRTEPVENEAQMSRGDNISYLSQLHDSFMLSLPRYLDRLNLGKRREHVEAFHRALSARLKQLSQLKQKISSSIPINLEKTGQHWLFDRNSMYRIIAMTGRHTESSLIDILIKHYESYEQTIDFLTSPPDDVLIIEVAPHNASKAHALLSKKDVLDSEYEIGVAAGANLLNAL